MEVAPPPKNAAKVSKEKQKTKKKITPRRKISNPRKREKIIQKKLVLRNVSNPSIKKGEYTKKGLLEAQIKVKAPKDKRIPNLKILNP